MKITISDTKYETELQGAIKKSSKSTTREEIPGYCIQVQFFYKNFKNLKKGYFKGIETQ